MSKYQPEGKSQVSKVAAIQRARTISFYKALTASPPNEKYLSSNISVKFCDNKPPVSADKISAVDSAETKFGIRGLETSWGIYEGNLAVRSSDIAYIDIDLEKIT